MFYLFIFYLFISKELVTLYIRTLAAQQGYKTLTVACLKTQNDELNNKNVGWLRQRREDSVLVWTYCISRAIVRHSALMTRSVPATSAAAGRLAAVMSASRRVHIPVSCIARCFVFFRSVSDARNALYYISRESQPTTRNVYWLHACLRVCLCTCLSLAACPHYCTDPDVTWGMVGGALQLCAIGRICNWCTGFVAMTTQPEHEMSASACTHCVPGSSLVCLNTTGRRN